MREAAALREQLEQLNAARAAEREQLELAQHEVRQVARREAAAREQQLAREMTHQQQRGLEQAAAAAEELRATKEQLAMVQAEVAEGREQLRHVLTEREAEQRRAATRLAMSEQAGGARAAALLAELERLRHGAGAGSGGRTGGADDTDAATMHATRVTVAAGSPRHTPAPRLAVAASPALLPAPPVGSGLAVESRRAPEHALRRGGACGGAIDARAMLAQLLED